MTSDALLLPGGDVVVPAAMLKELLHELEQPRQQVPLDVVTPHRSRQIAELVALIRDGAVAHHQRLRESFATLSHSPSVPPWEASVVAGSPSGSGEVVGVAVVAGMLGKSETWVRELARNGALPGARKVRGFGNGRGAAHAHWCIPLTSVHAYLQTREVMV
jgi:hypothetical protein